MKRKIDPENPTRLAILNAYRANPSITIRALAVRVGVANVTVTHHLRNLEAEGLITRIHNEKKSNLTEKELLARIDMVVEKAKQRETSVQHDVVRHINKPLRLRGMRSSGAV
jgi:DNA-binding MarR family transcriptional regulator